MSRSIKDSLRNCHICQLSKSNNINYVGESQSIIANDIGDYVMADLYGPLPKGKYGSAYILVFQDSFSKFVKLYDLRRATAKAVISKLKNFIKFIKPKAIMTDNGSQFISDLWRKLLSELGIKALYTTVRNPRPNITERVNKELGRIFRTYCHNSHKSWNTILPKIELLYNNSFHNSTGFTPNEILYGKGNALSFDKYLNVKDHCNKNIENIKDMVKLNLKESSRKRNDAYNKSHRLMSFQIGDYVKVKRCNKSDAKLKLTKRFELLYEGPYIVTAVPFPNVYTLLDPKTDNVWGNFNTIHMSRYYV